MRSHSRRNLLAHILLIGVVLVWGSTFPLVKSALNDISPLLFNLLRMTLAALVLLLINFKELRGLTRSELRLCLTAGLFLALGYSFQTTGLAHTTPSKSAFLTGLVVVLVPLLSLVPGVAPPTSPKPNTIVFLGAILAFAGLILLTSTPGTGAAILSGMHLGEWLTLLCAIAFAAHLLTLAHAAPQLSARRLGTLQIAFAAVFMLLALPLGGRPDAPPHLHRHPRPGHHRAARHRRRLHHPKLGPAAAAAHPHRAHPHARARLRRPHLAPLLPRALRPPRAPRRRPHPRRHPPRRAPRLRPRPRQRPRLTCALAKITCNLPQKSVSCRQFSADPAPRWRTLSVTPISR